MIFKLLQQARLQQASDLHLTGNQKPMLRWQGKIQAMSEAVVPQMEIDKALLLLLPECLQTELKRKGEVDCAYTDASGERYRINVYCHAGHYAMAVRLLASVIPDCASLGLPEAVCGFSSLAAGLVLVTGPTGSGKSTTLAALVNTINESRPVHIITLEDPVEYVYQQRRALIHQREIGRDTESFASGMRSALREDPDVLLVGELRDAETMAIALTAAETGHLVLATLHTRDAVSSVNRILDMLPHKQQQIRAQLAQCLQGIVCQRLLPDKSGAGRIAAFEVLVATDALRNLIREGRTHQLQSYLQTGSRYGMITMEDYINKLRKSGLL